MEKEKPNAAQIPSESMLKGNAPKKRLAVPITMSTRI
jgi:hypothetical protein